MSLSALKKGFYIAFQSEKLMEKGPGKCQEPVPEGVKRHKDETVLGEITYFGLKLSGGKAIL